MRSCPPLYGLLLICIGCLFAIFDVFFLIFEIYFCVEMVKLISLPNNSIVARASFFVLLFLPILLLMIILEIFGCYFVYNKYLVKLEENCIHTNQDPTKYLATDNIIGRI